MKKILSILFAFTMIFSSIALTGCSCSKKEETIMTVKSNPSVEFILDKNNKVLSVTALNEDGNVIIVNEEFVGKSADEAVELFVKLSTETGFIVKGSTNNIQVSISGSNKKAENIYNDVKDKVTTYLTNNSITATLEKIDAPTIEELKTLVKENCKELTEEEINSLTQNELITKLKEVRLQTKELFSQGLKDAYVLAKEYEIDFAKNEKTAEIIEGMNTVYQLAAATYTTALTSFSNAKQSLNQIRETYLLNENSLYQTKLKALNDAKDELVVKRNEVASMEEGEAKDLAASQLTTLESVYDTALIAYNNAFTTINSAINVAIDAIERIETKLSNLEKDLPQEVKTILTNKAQEIETAMNTAKDNVFKKFEEEYKTQIQKAKDAAIARKEALKQSINQ